MSAGGDRKNSYTSPHCLQTLRALSPSVFSQRSLTPVRVQAGQFPRQPLIVRASLPRLGFGIMMLLHINSVSKYYLRTAL
jgi:hypothetical protein